MLYGCASSDKTHASSVFISMNPTLPLPPLCAGK